MDLISIATTPPAGSSTTRSTSRPPSRDLRWYSRGRYELSYLWPDLGEHESVDHAPEQVTVTKHDQLVELQRRSDQRTSTM